MQKTTLIWFRRNLRLSGNAALRAAVARGLPVAAVFAVPRPSEITNPRQALFLHQAAAELARGLAERGVPLIALQGDTAAALAQWVQRLNAQTVFADEGYTPSEIFEDNRIWRILSEKGVAFERVNDRAVFAKSDLMDGHGRPFREFSPYRRAWLDAFARCFAADTEYGTADRPSENVVGVLFETHDVQTAFADVPPFPSAADLAYPPVGLPQAGGEQAAWRQWRQFCDHIGFYPHFKDFPAKKATSRLSAYLAAGCLPPRVLAQEAARLGAAEWLENLIRRDFYLQAAFHGSAGQAAAALPRHEDFFQRWTQGASGFPLIDAAMRCLNQSGWLAPVLRQAAAEFWCGTLRQPWQHGAAWFAAQQTDHDDALNRGNWQAAAARAHTRRAANPVLQSQQFDPDGTFIRRHIPELAHLPKEIIHTPWLAGADIDCHGYPPPIAPGQAV